MTSCFNWEKKNQLNLPSFTIALGPYGPCISYTEAFTFVAAQ